jgi:hypothetical protein
LSSVVNPDIKEMASNSFNKAEEVASQGLKIGEDLTTKGIKVGGEYAQKGMKVGETFAAKSLGILENVGRSTLGLLTVREEVESKQNQSNSTNNNNTESLHGNKPKNKKSRLRPLFMSDQLKSMIESPLSQNPTPPKSESTKELTTQTISQTTQSSSPSQIDSLTHLQVFIIVIFIYLISVFFV